MLSGVGEGKVVSRQWGEGPLRQSRCRALASARVAVLRYLVDENSKMRILT